MYHNYDDAENCIRAFYFLGYEAKFAKVLHFFGGVCFIAVLRHLLGIPQPASQGPQRQEQH